MAVAASEAGLAASRMSGTPVSSPAEFAKSPHSDSEALPIGAPKGITADAPAID